MANKYTRTPIPPKEDLEQLYHVELKTQIEIGNHFGVSQKVVFGWFRYLGIKSRVAFKRDQSGKNNSSWKGDNATYAAMYYRVQSQRGKAAKCEECGRSDDGMTYDWANQTGNYNDVTDYKEMCRSCHFKKDGHKKNFPNNDLVPNVNKRKIIDGK